MNARLLSEVLPPKPAHVAYFLDDEEDEASNEGELTHELKVAGGSGLSEKIHRINSTIQGRVSQGFRYPCPTNTITKLPLHGLFTLSIHDFHCVLVFCDLSCHFFPTSQNFTDADAREYVSLIYLAIMTRLSRQHASFLQPLFSKLNSPIFK